MQAQISTNRFLNAIDPVNVLVDECKMHLNEDGIQIRAVDPANVGMVDLDIEKEAFAKYQTNEGVIGVNLSRLMEKVQQIANQPQFDDEEEIQLEMELNEETRKLELSGGSMEFTLALIDPDSIRQEPDIPDLDLPAAVITEGSWLNHGIGSADTVSDHMEFGINEAEEEFYMMAAGDTDDLALDLDEHDGGIIEINPGPAHSIYSLDYLKDMKKAIPKDSEVTVLLGEEFPMKFKFALADGHVNVEYMLAPRVEGDGE